MTAIELADWCDDLFSSDGEPKKAAAMLRKQDAAIKQLREALKSIKQMSYSNSAQELACNVALAATEEFQK